MVPKSRKPILLLILLLLLRVSDAAWPQHWVLEAIEGEGLAKEAIEAGRISESIRILNETRRLQGAGDALGVHVNLCIAHALESRYARALHHCDRAVALPGPTAVAYYNRGVVRAVSGDHRGAAQDFCRVTCMRSCSPASRRHGTGIVERARHGLTRLAMARGVPGIGNIYFHPGL